MLIPPMRSIYKYTISVCLCLVTFSLQAQKVKTKPEMTDVKWFNGLTVQADLASLVVSALGGDNYSMEGGVQVDLKHKYYPIIEVGMAGANKTSIENIGYKTSGLFSRLGLDINLIKQKKDSKPTKNLFLTGIRIGMTHFKYDYTDISIKNDFWGGTETLDYSKIPSTKIWYEIIVGVRVEVVKNIFMGWSIRNKNLISSDLTGEVLPWYIPGYGLNASNNWGINYTLGYKF